MSADEISAIAVDYRSGLSKSDIAVKYGISRMTVYRTLERGQASKAGSSKYVRVYSRLTEDDFEALKGVAAERGETVAALSRRVLRRAAGFFDADREISAAVLELTTEMKKIGTNLNQVVYQINREALLQGRAVDNKHLGAIRAMQVSMIAQAKEVEKLLVRSGRKRLTTVAELLEKDADA